MDLDALVPALRPLDITRVRHQGQPYFVLRDPLALGGSEQLLAPELLGPLLARMDGRQSARALAETLQREAGLAIEAAQVARFAQQLSDACLLADDRSERARSEALAAYHAAPFRPPALADRVYPADPARLRATLSAFGAGIKPGIDPAIDGVISPHIDYTRGGPVYAAVWQAAAVAARAAEVVVIFGTDHSGGLNRITLTNQDYATPWGRLPTDAAARDAVVSALGPAVFAEELHHREEHSIELAAVWLHFIREGAPVPLLPVLCGHPGALMTAGAIGDGTSTGRALAALRPALAGRRALVVAAADLAHVGPNFGDRAPFDGRGRALVQAADEEMLGAKPLTADSVLQSARRIDDRFRICGLAPIACTLALLGPAIAETVAYDQCPADEDGGSFVSVAGALLRRDGDTAAVTNP